MILDTRRRRRGGLRRCVLPTHTPPRPHAIGPIANRLAVFTCMLQSPGCESFELVVLISRRDGATLGQSRLEMASGLRARRGAAAMAHPATKPRRALSMPHTLCRPAFRDRVWQGSGEAAADHMEPGDLDNPGSPPLSSSGAVYPGSIRGSSSQGELQEAPPAQRVMGPRRRRDSEERDTVGRGQRFPRAIQFAGRQRSQIDGAAMGSWR
ncbi:hypothetical protein GSI_11641 [Ganoderma sinense ZZ0214-1]|uniref:Uncharacterized protein n=1 Tax=Ganoderma sinense ZZ0214-1 TaxID=1077348 RepID=A0A2G8RX42_9APHY|nr:hypothetical protein GSI_11641 [Ganoderma sinense ZZ0214-1]